MSLENFVGRVLNEGTKSSKTRIREIRDFLYAKKVSESRRELVETLIDEI